MVSQSNPVSFACLPAVGIPNLYILCLDLEMGVPYLAGICVGSGDPDSGPHTYGKILNLSNPPSL